MRALGPKVSNLTLKDQEAKSLRGVFLETDLPYVLVVQNKRPQNGHNVGPLFG